MAIDRADHGLWWLGSDRDGSGYRAQGTVPTIWHRLALTPHFYHRCRVRTCAPQCENNE